MSSDDWSFDFSIANVNYKKNVKLKSDIGKLESDGLKESKQMALHLEIYKNMKNKRISKEKLKLTKKPFSLAKYELTREIYSRGHNVPIEAIDEFWRNKTSGYYLQLVEMIKDSSNYVLNTFYKTPLFNVLDVHYLFTLLEQIDEYYVKAIHLAGNAIEGKAEQSKVIRGDIEKLKDELQIWKNNKFMPDEEYIERKKIIYRSRWKQHKKTLHQRNIAKRSGVKRQEALMRKADTLKGRLRDLTAFKI